MSRRRGVALFLVLTVLLIVVMLTHVVLSLITSHSNLSNHQLRRIQAYYAAMAAINYATEQMRLGSGGWMPATNGQLTMYMCRGPSDPRCPTASPAVNETSLPYPIGFVQLTLGPLDGTTQTYFVNATVNYTAY